MTPRTRWSLPWGLIGGLTVLVVGFAGVLLEVGSLGPALVLATAIPVAVLSGAIAWLLAPRIAGLPERHA